MNRMPRTTFRSRSFLWIALCSALALAGCPQSGSDGSAGNQDSSSESVPPPAATEQPTTQSLDGIYSGYVSYLTEFRKSGTPYSQASSSAVVSATFAGGTNRTTDGQPVSAGTVVTTQLGALVLTSTAASVTTIDPTYQENYDVAAQWGGTIPMSGSQVSTYVRNPDGTIDFSDLIVLSSLTSFDGGLWTFRGSASGKLSTGPLGRPPPAASQPAPTAQLQSITGTVLGNGHVTFEPLGTSLGSAGFSYPTGTTVRLTAIPADGWYFVGWAGDVVRTDSPLQLKLDRNFQIVAVFDPVVPVVAPAYFGAILVAYDGTFLGDVNADVFDSASLANAFGTYGNQYSVQSIWNSFGRYGSTFSTLSPFNSFSTTPPIIKINGQPYAYLSTNHFLSGTVIDPSDLAVAIGRYDVLR